MRLKRTISKTGASLFLVLILLQALQAQEPIGEPGRSSDQPNPLRNVYFGEQHIHTENSFDAFPIGTRMSWEDCYNYAKGEEMILLTPAQNKVKKATPYDFMGLTDHAEYLGIMKSMTEPDSPLSESPLAKGVASGSMKAVSQLLVTLGTGIPIPDYVTPELIKGQWNDYVTAANKAYEPGKFTTLIAFEWTSMPGNINMHRNVFFRDDKGPEVPFSAFDSYHPEDLWTYMDIQRKAGHECIAIPHNGNASDGWMYSPYKFLGGPMDVQYAKRQSEHEPLTELTQTKGTSEVHPALAPSDEFAGFELFTVLLQVGKPGQIKYSYYRQALTEGMRLEQSLGYNPYKMGVVSGSDFHSGYSGNEEFNYHGSHGGEDDTPEKRLSPKANMLGVINAGISSAGATAVWAEENTRASIFDAMKRKETYGTSGPLIRLRFFGGWDFPGNLTEDDDFVKKAYESGVPMGGDLKAKPAGSKAPTFAVWALKDPQSGNLDRVQIVKVWLNKRFGRHVEKIYNVSLSDNRKVDPETGKAPPVGNSVIK